MITGSAQTLAAGKDFTLQGKTRVLTKTQAVEIYTSNGKQIYSGITQSVNLPQPGMYIVRTPQAVGKVMVR